MKNALIVDDSRLACKVMANMLASMEIKSAAVYSAEDALEFLQNRIPDVIFLDHTMPGISGLELIKLIKRNPKLSKVPVLMYTAKEGKVYAERAKELGAIDVLPKGLEKKSLSKALGKIGLITNPNDADQPPSTVKDKTSELNISNEEVTVQEKPVWQSFWLQKAEPYLNQHKIYCVDEVQRSSKLQTRQIKREFHQTLESFEHAIFHRMQSHNEFVEAQEQLTKNFYRKIAIGLGGFGCFLLLIVFWQLWQVNQQNKAILNLQQDTSTKQQQIEEQVLSISQRLENLDNQFQQDPIENTSLGFNGVALLDEQGGLISELFSVESNRDLYTGKTKTGYNFVVNSQGELGLPIKQRYFLTDDCTGDTFVDSPSGTILKDLDGGIWYVDILASAMLLTANSRSAEDNECIPVNGDLLNLNRLLPNQIIETGIDEKQLTELYFG